MKMWNRMRTPVTPGKLAFPSFCPGGPNSPSAGTGEPCGPAAGCNCLPGYLCNGTVCVGPPLPPVDVSADPPGPAADARCAAASNAACVVGSSVPAECCANSQEGCLPNPVFTGLPGVPFTCQVAGLPPRIMQVRMVGGAAVKKPVECTLSASPPSCDGAVTLEVAGVNDSGTTGKAGIEIEILPAADNFEWKVQFKKFVDAKYKNRFKGGFPNAGDAKRSFVFKTHLQPVGGSASPVCHDPPKSNRKKDFFLYEPAVDGAKSKCSARTTSRFFRLVAGGLCDGATVEGPADLEATISRRAAGSTDAFNEVGTLNIAVKKKATGTCPVIDPCENWRPACGACLRSKCLFRPGPACPGTIIDDFYPWSFLGDVEAGGDPLDSCQICQCGISGNDDIDDDVEVP